MQLFLIPRYHFAPDQKLHRAILLQALTWSWREFRPRWVPRLLQLWTPQTAQEEQDQQDMYDLVIPEAAKVDNVEALREILRRVKPDKWARPRLERQAIALLFAAQKSHIHVVRYLLEHPSHLAVLFPDHAGRALRSAASQGSPEIVEALAERHTDVNYTQDSFQAPPLLVAAFRNHGPVVRKLLRYGARKTLRAITGRSQSEMDKDAIFRILQFAVEGGLKDAIRGLVKAGADVNYQPTESENQGWHSAPLCSIARSWGQRDTLALLKELGAKDDADFKIQGA